MYFWRINKLKDHLVQNGLSNFQAFIYFCIYIFSMALAILLPLDTGNILDKISMLSLFLSTIIGIPYCYLMNGGEKGAAFVGRFLAIDFVMTIRLLSIALLPLIVTWVLADSHIASWPQVIIEIGFDIIFYWRVGHHLRDVARRTTEAPEPIEVAPIDPASTPELQ